MDTVDGDTLRRIRERMRVTQATVARAAGVSTGQISRVENGHRPPSPAVISGYERAFGIRLTSPQVQSHLQNTHRFDEDTDDMKRRAFVAAIGAIAAGGPAGEPISRALAALGHAETPSRVGLADVLQVEQATTMFTTWDLRFGGGLAQEMATTQLRWATGLLDAAMSQPVRTRLNSAVAMLAERTAWSTFDSGRHHAARGLFKHALVAATEADDADLRAHILSDIATQQQYLGHPDECLTIVRLAEGDDRLSPAVRVVLHGVKARAFGALGHEEACRHQIGVAEDAYTSARSHDTPDWMKGFLSEAHVYSVTGQAMYSLAQTTRTFSDEAHQRLTRAIDGFDNSRARAIALCATRLATLHLAAGHLPEGTTAALTALQATPGLRSARITKDLATMLTAARQHPAMDSISGDIAQVAGATTWRSQQSDRHPAAPGHPAGRGWQ